MATAGKFDDAPIYRRASFWWILLGFVSLLVGAAGIRELHDINTTPGDRAASGDFWGSLITATMSTAGMFFFLAALANQREDLRIQRDELRLQRGELRAQREELTKSREMQRDHLAVAELHMRESMKAMAVQQFCEIAALRVQLRRDLMAESRVQLTGRPDPKQYLEGLLLASEFSTSVLSDFTRGPHIDPDIREKLTQIQRNL